VGRWGRDVVMGIGKWLAKICKKEGRGGSGASGVIEGQLECGEDGTKG